MFQKKRKKPWNKKQFKRNTKIFVCTLHIPNKPVEKIEFQYHQFNGNFGQVLPRPEYDGIGSYIDYLRKTPTRSEQLTIDFLNKHNFNFIFQHQINNFIVDFYFPDLNLCLELDGAFHRTIKDKDKKRNEILMSMDYNLIRVPSYLAFVNVQTIITLIETFKAGL